MKDDLIEVEKFCFRRKDYRSHQLSPVWIQGKLQEDIKDVIVYFGCESKMWRVPNESAQRIYLSIKRQMESE